MERGSEACSSCHRQIGPPAGLAQSAGNTAICQDCAEGEAEQLCPTPESLPVCNACAAGLWLTCMSTGSWKAHEGFTCNHTLPA